MSNSRLSTKELLALGADVNVANDTGLRPLHYAACQGVDVVDLLLRAGADVNADDTVHSFCV